MGIEIPSRIESGKQKANGYVTPKEDKSPQKMSILPRRAIPIVFLPGIMGSNLRMTPNRQALLNRKNNIAWRPDRLSETLAFLSMTAAERQRQLDPATTEVDSFEGGFAPTGDRLESAQKRQDCGAIRVSFPAADALLLIDDPPTSKPCRSKEDKALDRGWGEILFSSYRHILEMCEQQLNRPTIFGGCWGRVIDEDPKIWGAVENPQQFKLTEAELKDATKGCLFPVHAMGYNWLQSIDRSAKSLADRIRVLIEKYTALGIRCEKVIVVTHSMGGLVGRALIHPKMGNIENKILGVVHGVQPVCGAPAAYRRMRCGFEEGPLGIDPTPKILGNFGAEVTAVLGNAAGALQLLPNCAYGNGWLRIVHNGLLVDSWPKKNDPYKEIYCVRGKWYGLLREEWLNPAGDRRAGFITTCNLLNIAKRFHQDLEHTYHPLSYAHYGADAGLPSWETVSWIYDSPILTSGWQDLHIQKDSGQGALTLKKPAAPHDTPSRITARLGPATGAGDQTVPARSSDHQLRSEKFTGIFRQTGYEHQASYCDIKALYATLYSIVKIAATIKWHDE